MTDMEPAGRKPESDDNSHNQEKIKGRDVAAEKNKPLEDKKDAPSQGERRDGGRDVNEQTKRNIQRAIKQKDVKSPAASATALAAREASKTVSKAAKTAAVGLKKAAAKLLARKTSGPPSSPLGMALVLFSCTLVVALLLGVLSEVTSSVIAANLREQTVESLRLLYPEADSFEPAQPAGDGVAFFKSVAEVYRAFDGDEYVGICVRVLATGFVDDIDMMVGISPETLSVTGVAILSSAETADIGTKVLAREYLSLFQSKTLPLQLVRSAPKNENEIQAVSGATVTSNAVASGVKSALEAAGLLEAGEGDD